MTTIPFYIQPRASKTEVVGFFGEAIKIRIKAPPVDGAANKELIRFLSKALRISKSSIRIATGETSRRKHIAFEAMNREEIVTTLVVSP
jgi:uncharacterized protein (TIGR00251 family)